MRGVGAVRAIGLLVLLLGASAPAHAHVFYEYVGNTFPVLGIQDPDPPSGTAFTTSDLVSITLEFAQPFSPGSSSADVRSLVLSYSFRAGNQEITLSDSSLVEPLALTIDASGEIVAWQAVAHTEAPVNDGEQQTKIESRSLSLQRDLAALVECEGSGFGCGLVEDRAIITNAPGAWTLVPEPGTAALLGLGLLALGARRQRLR